MSWLERVKPEAVDDVRFGSISAAGALSGSGLLKQRVAQD